MAQVTKATLVAENESLRKQVVKLTVDLETLRAAAVAPVPSAPVHTGRIAITACNPIFAGLPVYQPHSKIVCPVHKASQSNKAGFCTLCSNERARGRMAA